MITSSKAQKFLPDAYMPESNLLIRAWIQEQSHPGAAAKEGRRRDLPLRDDWEDEVEFTVGEIEPVGMLVKDWCMYKALEYKFSQHDDLATILLSTGNRMIIEDSPIDWYWGWGADHKGKNMLGRLLMKLRGESLFDAK